MDDPNVAYNREQSLAGQTVFNEVTKQENLAILVWLLPHHRIGGS